MISLYFIGFTTALSALLGDPLPGLTAGLGIVFVASGLNKVSKIGQQQQQKTELFESLRKGLEGRLATLPPSE